MNILISGAGVAGLALARTLKKQNIPFTLIEKKAQITPVGAGIALPANAISALRQLGLADAVLQKAHQVTDILYTKASGRILAQASLLEAPLNQDKFVALHRAQLCDVLFETLDHDIHFNTSIESMEQTADGVYVTFNDKALAGKYDAVIGADGLYSNVRTLALGEVEYDDLGITNWRWTCEYPTDDLQPTYMFGTKSVFLVYPIGPRSVYCYAQSYDPGSTLLKCDDYHQLLSELFGKFGGLALKMLQRLPSNDKIISGRLRSVPQPFFTNGRVAFIGDACSACSPMLQQGAACAFEDIVVLTRLLGKYSIPEAFEKYENARKQRVSWIITASDGPIKKIAGKSSPLFIMMRNLLIRCKGPLNVLGWKKLLAEDPYITLE